MSYNVLIVWYKSILILTLWLQKKNKLKQLVSYTLSLWYVRWVYVLYVDLSELFWVSNIFKWLWLFKMMCRWLAYGIYPSMLHLEALT